MKKRNLSRFYYIYILLYVQFTMYIYILPFIFFIIYIFYQIYIYISFIYIFFHLLLYIYILTYIYFIIYILYIYTLLYIQKSKSNIIRPINFLALRTRYLIQIYNFQHKIILNIIKIFKYKLLILWLIIYGSKNGG